MGISGGLVAPGREKSTPKGPLPGANGEAEGRGF